MIITKNFGLPLFGAGHDFFARSYNQSLEIIDDKMNEIDTTAKDAVTKAEDAADKATGAIDEIGDIQTDVNNLKVFTGNNAMSKANIFTKVFDSNDDWTPGGVWTNYQTALTIGYLNGFGFIRLSSGVRGKAGSYRILAKDKFPLNLRIMNSNGVFDINSFNNLPLNVGITNPFTAGYNASNINVYFTLTNTGAYFVDFILNSDFEDGYFVNGWAMFPAKIV